MIFSQKKKKKQVSEKSTLLTGISFCSSPFHLIATPTPPPQLPNYFNN